MCAYPGSDVAVMPVFLNVRLSWANVPAPCIDVFSIPFTSSSHLLLGRPLPRLSATLPSISLLQAVVPRHMSKKLQLSSLYRSQKLFFPDQTNLAHFLVGHVLGVGDSQDLPCALILISCNPLLYSSREHPRFASVGGHREDDCL